MKPRIEDIKKSRNKSLEIKHYKISSFNTHLHIHNLYELTLILKGNGIRYVGNHIEEFYEKDLILLGPDSPHNWKWQTKQGEAVVILVSQENLNNIVQNIPETKHLSKLFDDSHCGLSFNKSKSRNELIKIMKNIASISPCAQIGAFLNICDIMSNENYEKLASNWYAQSSPKAKNKIKEINNYILDNFTEPINVESLAVKHGMSRTGFSRFYKNSTGKSCMQHIIEMRLGLACDQLEQTDETILNICLECGFNNLANFNRVFKSNQNMTPTEYRKRHR